MTTYLDRQRIAHLVPSLLSERLDVEMVVTGESMGATIPTGSTVRVEPVAADDIRLGDVVLYGDSAGGLIMHRVIRTRVGNNTKQLQTRGDGMWLMEPWIDAERVVGRVQDVTAPHGKTLHLGRARRRNKARQLWGLAVSGLMYKSLKLRRRIFLWDRERRRL